MIDQEMIDEEMIDQEMIDQVDDRNLFKEKKEKEFSTTEEDFPDLLKPSRM